MRSCLIMGSGRSGTSLMAGLLSDSGYYQGARLLRPKEDNPRGFFEDRYINDLNERIMGSALRFTRLRWLHRLAPRIPLRTNGWMALLPLDARVEASRSQQGEIAALVAREPYCYKDPRFSYTYPAWRPFLAGAGPALSIVVFRHPAEVCASVLSFFSRRRASYAPRFIFEVWLGIYQHILEHARQGGDWLFVNYRDLLSGQAIPRVEQELGTATNRQMIDPALNRSRERAGGLEAPEACLDMYRRLLTLAERSDLAGSEQKVQLDAS
jgi:hypothetical protein